MPGCERCADLEQTVERLRSALAVIAAGTVRSVPVPRQVRDLAKEALRG